MNYKDQIQKRREVLTNLENFIKKCELDYNEKVQDSFKSFMFNRRLRYEISPQSNYIENEDGSIDFNLIISYRHIAGYKITYNEKLEIMSEVEKIFEKRVGDLSHNSQFTIKYKNK